MFKLLSYAPAHTWASAQLVHQLSPECTSSRLCTCSFALRCTHDAPFVGSQHLLLRNHIFGLTHRIMVKRLAKPPHDPLGITDCACKNQSVMVSVQYGPFNTNIPIRSTTIGKSRVPRDSITMHTSWRSNSDIACVTRRLTPTNSTGKLALQRLTGYDLLIRSTTKISIPSPVCTRNQRKFHRRNLLAGTVGTNSDGVGGGGEEIRGKEENIS
ncbi:hypothetical protein F511_25491 [Dorcoceras hygrometricum]|uniref:Uncharacterized protein n=1 Tax=Dorcoceras hygrometricum TaxID=472368 RepID=A0A2Z7D7I6_9LAMI|nr:hypothetical protein F511_25491 [Dorcoceras hygrometricum]